MTFTEQPTSVAAAGSVATSAAWLASPAAAALWLVLAISNPTSTYHFAPVIVVAATALTVCALGAWQPPGDAHGIATAAYGAVTAGIAIAIAVATTSLEGPTLWGSGDALVETILAVPVGLALVGARRWLS